LRQALIRPLRVLVPGVFGMALLSGIAVTLLGGSRLEIALRCGGLFALVCFISITLGGTVPINDAVLNWNAASPPTEWCVDQEVGTTRHVTDVGGDCCLLFLRCSAYGALINRLRIKMKIVQQTIESLGFPMWIEPLKRADGSTAVTAR
jgi:hypothetical protein